MFVYLCGWMSLWSGAYLGHDERGPQDSDARPSCWIAKSGFNPCSNPAAATYFSTRQSRPRPSLLTSARRGPRSPTPGARRGRARRRRAAAPSCSLWARSSPPGGPPAPCMHVCGCVWVCGKCVSVNGGSTNASTISTMSNTATHERATIPAATKKEARRGEARRTAPRWWCRWRRGCCTGPAAP